MPPVMRAVPERFEIARAGSGAESDSSAKILSSKRSVPQIARLPGGCDGAASMWLRRRILSAERKSSMSIARSSV